MKYDIRLLTKAADTLLKTTNDPRHRRILLNYRRHAMLEVSGRYEEIFSPDMTVENPFYRIADKNGLLELEGQKAVKGFYEGMRSHSATVIMLEHESLVVSDWGFASEALYHIFMPGRAAAENGYEIDDPSATYIETKWVSMIWPYDDQGRMIGERVYPAPTGTVRKCPEDEVLTVEEVRATLAGLL